MVLDLSVYTIQYTRLHIVSMHQKKGHHSPYPKTKNFALADGYRMTEKCPMIPM